MKIKRVIKEKEKWTLHEGDCIEVMKSIPDKSVELLLTDIPYGEVNRGSNGLRNLNKDKADIFELNIEYLIDEFSRVSNGSIYVFCGIGQVSIIWKKMIENKLSTRLIIWEKSNPSPMNGQRIWLSGVECCVFGKFSKAIFNEHCKNTVLKLPNGRSKQHPTEKPIKLFEYLVSVSSNEGDTILDPFAGSGTTGVACLNQNRNCIMVEKEPKYCEIIKKRMAENEKRIIESSK